MADMNTGWWLTYPSEKWWSESQLGWFSIPNWMESHRIHVPVTTNQNSCISLSYKIHISSPLQSIQDGHKILSKPPAVRCDGRATWPSPACAPRSTWRASDSCWSPWAATCGGPRHKGSRKVVIKSLKLLQFLLFLDSHSSYLITFPWSSQIPQSHPWPWPTSVRPCLKLLHVHIEQACACHLAGCHDLAVLTCPSVRWQSDPVATSGT